MTTTIITYVIGIFVTFALAFPFISDWHYYHVKPPQYTLDQINKELEDVENAIANETDYYELKFLIDKRSMFRLEKEKTLRFMKREEKKNVV